MFNEYKKLYELGLEARANGRMKKIDKYSIRRLKINSDYKLILLIDKKTKTLNVIFPSLLSPYALFHKHIKAILSTHMDQLDNGVEVIHYYNYYSNRCFNQINDILEKLVYDTVNFVGYSDGGGIALALAHRLLRTYGHNINVATIAQPEIGNAQFAHELSYSQITYTRILYNTDIIAHPRNHNGLMNPGADDLILLKNKWWYHLPFKFIKLMVHEEYFKKD